ncbi:ARC6/PARC6 family protein [Nostoc sp. FACHB-87]|uniref:ARC6/PARC6 family protein n=1 Tax=Nostocaceae TaxID=1162 RepID=UPI001689FEE6|nr:MULTISPECIES: ARC6/PARC6 family protein [Nostocaceae]MBD2456684.1 ARC6/PARC6 family protein [Nostoc sp. FACHB-87]MBD2478062.1 ARC6/PARC6 family protein [Anabaena sp. FACHB-83]
MKNLILYLSLFTIYGCNALRGSSSLVSPASNSNCPEKPTVALREKDVEQISLNEQVLTKSGQASVTKAIGYKFLANSGDKLNYQTNETLCIWVYSPDNELISGATLPKTGQYIIQVSASQGAKTFNLNMSLGELQTAINSTTQLPSNTIPTPTITATSTATSGNDLTQEQALEIVKRWYEAKPRIFASPFDTGLVSQLTTGTIYEKTVGTDGSIPWLRRNDAYYKYSKSEVRNVIDFANSGRQPYIKVRIFEELYLYGRNGIDRDTSGPYEGDFIYWFEKDNGVWKIYDYKKVS